MKRYLAGLLAVLAERLFQQLYYLPPQHVDQLLTVPQNCPLVELRRAEVHETDIGQPHALLVALPGDLNEVQFEGALRGVDAAPHCQLFVFGSVEGDGRFIHAGGLIEGVNDEV